MLLIAPFPVNGELERTAGYDRCYGASDVGFPFLVQSWW